MTKSKIALVSVGVPWFDLDTANLNLQATREVLQHAFDVHGPETTVADDAEFTRTLAELRQQDVSAAVFQIGTFPDGNSPAQLAETLGVPVVLSAFPEPSLASRVPNNSLCGLNMSTYTLSELGHPHSFVFGDPRTEASADELLQHVRAAVALRELRGSVVGLIGSRAPGFYPATFDELLLRRSFGVRVEHVGIQEVTDKVRSGASRAVPATSFPTIEGGELSPEAITWLGRYYGAVSETVAEHGLKTIAIKDWPEMAPFDPLIPAGIWPALSWLQDDGVNLAPEGDVNGAVTMDLLARLSGNTPFFSDISAFDRQTSTLVLWHYGGATRLARSAEEIRYGADGRELEFTLKPGAGVLARLGYHAGRYRLLIVEVEVLDERMTLRRAGARVRTTHTNANEVVKTMLNDAWEHHVSFVHGDVAESLAAFGHAWPETAEPSARWRCAIEPRGGSHPRGSETDCVRIAVPTPYATIPSRCSQMSHPLTPSSRLRDTVTHVTVRHRGMRCRHLEVDHGILAHHPHHPQRPSRLRARPQDGAHGCQVHATLGRGARPPARRLRQQRRQPHLGVAGRCDQLPDGGGGQQLLALTGKEVLMGRRSHAGRMVDSQRGRGTVAGISACQLLMRIDIERLLSRVDVSRRQVGRLAATPLRAGTV